MRIDDRLIHGQVIAVWCKHRHFTRIVIADDGVAADPFMQEVLKLAAPDLQVDVYSLADAIAALNADRPDRGTTMALVKSPLAARQLYDGGLEYRALNVGGIGSGPGRRNIFKSISASSEEISILKYLMDKGVEITLLTVPGEASKAFKDLAGKL